MGIIPPVSELTICSSSARCRRAYVGTPEPAALNAVADQLDHVIEHGEPEQAMALLAILIAELRVNSRNEILPRFPGGATWVALARQIAGLEGHAIDIVPPA
jgi:hypothetical protein